LSETFYPTVEQIDVIIAFLMELCCILDSHAFVKMIDYNDFVFPVFIVVEFCDRLVTLDVGPWIAQCFFNMVFFIFLMFTQIQQQELSIKVHW
jgi:hypothetical protein